MKRFEYRVVSELALKYPGIDFTTEDRDEAFERARSINLSNGFEGRDEYFVQSRRVTDWRKETP